MEPDEKGIRWLVDLCILLGILLLIALIALIAWPIFRFMDIGQPEEKRVANDFIRSLFDPGEIVLCTKSSCE